MTPVNIANSVLFVYPVRGSLPSQVANIVGSPLGFEVVYLLNEWDQQLAICVGLDQAFDKRYEARIHHVADVRWGMYRSLPCHEIAQVLLTDGVDFCRQIAGKWQRKSKHSWVHRLSMAFDALSV